MRYSRVCTQYSDFRVAELLNQYLLKQSYVGPRLQSSIQKCYGHHHELDNCYIISFYMYVDLFISSITDKNVTRLDYREHLGYPFSLSF